MLSLPLHAKPPYTAENVDAMTPSFTLIGSSQLPAYPQNRLEFTPNTKKYSREQKCEYDCGKHSAALFVGFDDESPSATLGTRIVVSKQGTTLFNLVRWFQSQNDRIKLVYNRLPFVSDEPRTGIGTEVFVVSYKPPDDVTKTEQQPFGMMYNCMSDEFARSILTSHEHPRPGKFDQNMIALILVYVDDGVSHYITLAKSTQKAQSDKFLVYDTLQGSSFTVTKNHALELLKGSLAVIAWTSNGSKENVSFKEEHIKLADSHTANHEAQKRHSPLRPDGKSPLPMTRLSWNS